MRLLLGFALAALVARAAPPAVVSPDVQPGREVTFRLRAPHAQQVLMVLEGSARPAPMVRGTDGVWTLTEGPLDPDYYSYSFLEDGVALIDPSNPSIKPSLVSPASMLHVPGPRSLPWEWNDVPHGVIHHEFFHSNVVGDDRDFYVYTPPGYDPRSARHYPVLYLLHGYTDGASAWSVVGRAGVILDNFIARGDAEPMIVVMPLGYGDPEILAEPFSPATRGLWQRNLEQFRQSLLREVLPRVIAQYQTGEDRESRAIAGVSMGAAESLYVGLNDLDDFAWIGSFSPGIELNALDGGLGAQFPQLSDEDNQRIRLLWIGCGTDDPSHLAVSRSMREFLAQRGIRNTYQETPGAHTWMVWRRYLDSFAPLLFR